jgi:hypothetical protein
MIYYRLLILLFLILANINSMSATIPVINGNNDGAGSLRFAIASAQNNDVIAFQGPIVVQLLTPLTLDKTLSIIGVTGARITRANGAPPFRLITVDNFTPRTGVIIFQNLIFSEGVASVGAAIRNFYPSLEVINCTFEQNIGSAISSNTNSTNVVVRQYVFRNNQGELGIGFENIAGTATIEQCDFVSNISSADGGAIFASGGAVFNQGATATPTFINCVFSGNQAQFGGGLYNESAQTRIINSTFSANQVSANGGGIYSYGLPLATVRNSISLGKCK